MLTHEGFVAETLSKNFIIGCGDVGRRVGRLLRARGETVTGVARSAESCERIVQAGLEALRWDMDTEPAPALGDLNGARVFYFAPPPRQGQDDPRLAAFLKAVDALPARLIYLSTSGVYGDCGGEWVDETRPPAPLTDRAHRRLAAETRTHGWAAAHGAEAVILRVPGIYGPGRLPIERLRRGVPVVRTREAPFSNRIHADDLAAAAVRIADRGQDRRIYNVSDGNPTTMTDYFLRVAQVADLPPPPQIALAKALETMTPAMASFLRESRRLDCTRLFQELDFAPRHADLTEGIRQSLTGE